MGKNMKQISQSFLILLVLLSAVSSAQVADAPANVAAALTVKLVGFAENLSETGKEITIHVIGAPDVAAELEKGIGKPVGKATLKGVTSGSGMPASVPTVLFIGDASKLADGIAYTQSNKILSITSKPDLVSKGSTLGVGVGEDGKPKILLNLTSSNEEGINWNPAIMKVAQTIK